MTALLTSQTTDGLASITTPALTDDVEEDEDDGMRGSDDETSDANESPNESSESDDDYRRGKGKRKLKAKKKRDNGEELDKPKRTNEPWKREEDLILMRAFVESGHSKLCHVVEAYNAKLKSTGFNPRTKNAVVQRIPLIDADMEFENAVALAQTRGTWTDDLMWIDEEITVLKKLLPQKLSKSGRKARKVLRAAYILFTEGVGNLGIRYHPRTKEEFMAQVEVLENCQDAFDPPTPVCTDIISVASPVSVSRTRRSRQDLPPLSRTKRSSRSHEDESATEQEDSGSVSNEDKSSDGDTTAGKKRDHGTDGEGDGEDDDVVGTQPKRQRTADSVCEPRAHTLAVKHSAHECATVVVDGVAIRLLQQGLDAVNNTLRRMQENHSLHSERSIDEHYRTVHSSFTDAQALAMHERGRHVQQLLHVIKTTIEGMEVCTERKGVEHEGVETARQHKLEVEGPLTRRSVEARSGALAGVHKMTSRQLASTTALVDATRTEDHSTVPPFVALAGVLESDWKELNGAIEHVADVEALGDLLQETLPRLTNAVKLATTDCAFLDNKMTMYVDILSAAMAAYVQHHTVRQARMAAKAKEVAEEIADYECGKFTVGRREELRKHMADCQKCIKDSTDKMDEVVQLHRDHWDRSSTLYPQAAHGKVETMYKSLSKALTGECNKSIRAATENIAAGIRQRPKPTDQEQQLQPAPIAPWYKRVVAVFAS